MRQVDETRYTKRTVVKERVPSRVLNEQRGVKIVLPPGFDERISYPALYCQDGDDFLYFGRVATQLTRLVLEEGLEPAIIVAVEVDKARRTDEYAPEGERFSAYCEFFARELVPFVEERFPVRSDPGERVVAGDSLGGAVSLHLALDYPGVFRRVLSLSGAFLEGTLERVKRERDLTWLDLYMVIGLGERQVATARGTFDFLRCNREAKALLEQRRAKLRYVEKEGEHLWKFWQNELPAALDYFFGNATVRLT